MGNHAAPGVFDISAIRTMEPIGPMEERGPWATAWSRIQSGLGAEFGVHADQIVVWKREQRQAR